MSLFLKLAFLFLIGSVSGWGIEVLFRRFLSRANPERKWINPGFCTGPYLPLYGCGLCLMYLIAGLEQYIVIASPFWSKLLLFLLMAVCMTLIEYIAGIISLKAGKVRLWDYTNEWGNIQGIICPKFSLIWAALGAVYYWLVHPYILDAINWLSQNLAYSFGVGMFFGIFIVDVAKSVQLTAKLKQFAEENNVVVRYEMLKADIRLHYEKSTQKYHFFRPFHSDRALSEHLKEMMGSFEMRRKQKKENS